MGTNPDTRAPLTCLVGQHVALGPVSRELVALVVKWRNDFEVTRTLAPRWRQIAWEAAEAWYERGAKDETHASFMVYECPTMRPIGFTVLMDIDHFDRTAEFAIVIGEKDCWGKGYGTEATSLTLDYGFNWLCLHNIRLRVYAYNDHAARIYERVGFKTIGRWRQAHALGNRLHDVILMDCLATEFLSPVVKQWLPDDPLAR